MAILGRLSDLEVRWQQKEHEHAQYRPDYFGRINNDDDDDDDDDDKIVFQSKADTRDHDTQTHFLHL